MLSIRQVARAAFRFAAAVEPPRAHASGRPRSLLDPRHLARASLLTARFGSEFLETLWKGPAVGVGYTELDNKVRAFHFFESVVAHLELRPGTLLPAEAIRSAQERLGREQAVWATEGIGWELVERRRRAGVSTDGLLRAPDEDVPGGSWTVLHTGMGMALAETGLERLSSASDPPQLRVALAQYIDLCERASRPGYAELAFEPLGLVTRLLRPGLVAAVGEQLAAIGAPWSELFWHGIGRGLYFLPANLPPRRSAPWAGHAMSLEEPPDDASRRNAAAGFGWAVTLVNLRYPALVEAFLAHHAGPGAPGDAVAQGVASALQLWHETTGGSKELRRFVGHVAAPLRRGLWQRVVRLPFEEAVERRARAGASRDVRRVADLFRYQAQAAAAG
jgi:hypothetical protein